MRGTSGGHETGGNAPETGFGDRLDGDVRGSTGLVIKDPAHIKQGEKVRVSTVTGEFMGRA